jgi:hypothetical protein
VNKEEEIALVQAIIDAPAGYDLDLFGGMLIIRSTGGPMNDEETIEVEWNMMIETKAEVGTQSFQKTDSLAAARFFVEKRHELRCGIDFEQLDMAAHMRHESPR